MWGRVSHRLGREGRSTARFGSSDHHSSTAWQFSVRDFRQEIEFEAQSRCLMTCRFVEKVHDISTKPIFEAAALIDVEGADRIHLDVG